ncbi:MAG: hypothetical protein AAFV53_13065 [Myxococcota bacterium]
MNAVYFDVMESLGQQVIRARKARGWTMQDLANAAQVSIGVVHKVEHDQNVQDKYRHKIFRALGAVLEQRLIIDTSEERHQIASEAAKLSDDLVGTGARILRVLPNLPDEHVRVLLAWVALYDPESKPE